MSPQCESLLQYLRDGNSITPLESVSVLGIMALSQRCTELRAAGYPVVSELISTPSNKRVARYRLANDGRSS